MDGTDMSDFVEHQWPVDMKCVDLDHGYRLYGAISRHTPAFHDGPWQLAPLLAYDGRERRRLSGRGLLRIRGEVSTDLLSMLSNSNLPVGSKGGLEIGPGSIVLVTPAAQLRARLVTIKSALDALDFVGKVQTQLEARMGRVPLVELGRRRVMCVANKLVVGWGVTLHGLTDAESLAVQREGVGGRRRMGGGVFLPP